MQPVLDAQRRALDMKAGTGAKFACEAGVDSLGNVGTARQISNAKVVREVGVRLLEPIEVLSCSPFQAAGAENLCSFVSSCSAWPPLGKAGGTIMKRRLIML